MAKDQPQAGVTWRKLLWFVALWGAGVVTIAAVGCVLRAVFFS